MSRVTTRYCPATHIFETDDVTESPPGRRKAILAFALPSLLGIFNFSDTHKGRWQLDHHDGLAVIRGHYVTLATP